MTQGAPDSPAAAHSFPPAPRSSALTPTLPQYVVIIAFLSIWIGLAASLFPLWSALLARPPAQSLTLLHTLPTAWLLLATLYATYHLTSFLTSLRARVRSRANRVHHTSPPVAILYTCKNDFRERSLRSCASQLYPNFWVYVLDDSSSAAERRRVDVTVRSMSNVSILRRTTGAPLKASNLNHALFLLDSYSYFAVADADEVLPPQFLRETVSIAEADPTIGFVQASHEAYGDSAFARDHGAGIDTHWSYFLPARNRNGFVYFYGHGALLRSSAVLKVGGFPELVAEDLALTARLRRAGFRGYYSHEVRCFEEVPPTYEQFLRRSAKVLAGTWQFLTSEYSAFCRSKNVPLLEKLDLTLAVSVVLLPIAFCAFLSLQSLILIRHLIVASEAHGGVILPEFTSFSYAWYIKLLILSVVLAPLIYTLPALCRRPTHVVAYAFRSCTVHLSALPYLCLAFIQAVVRGRANFVVTGDRSLHSASSKAPMLSGLAGASLAPFALAVGSSLLFAISLSLILAPLCARWYGRVGIVRHLVLAPLCLVIAGFCIDPVFASITGGLILTLGAGHSQH